MFLGDDSGVVAVQDLVTAVITEEGRTDNKEGSLQRSGAYGAVADAVEDLGLHLTEDLGSTEGARSGELPKFLTQLDSAHVRFRRCGSVP